ncbi:MAG: peptidyl-prolyl cis-trans isomerase [Blastocatellia bacterium]|nr:peptidyl-prolyl cis-trans isomerase [Blastocatellia bacterium]
MKSIQALICFIVLSILPLGSFAQDENGYNLLDQVIARVNTEVILMSAFERELKMYIEEFKQRGKSDTEIEKELTETRAKILDGLIDQQLLTQRAKELSIDVEAQVNEQLVRLMKEVGCDSLECLEQKMREVGVDINEQRRGLRMRFMADAVLGREVYGDVSRKVTDQEKRQFYDKHKEWFVVPGEVDLSRIFIRKPKEPAAQEQALSKAKEIATLIKGGGDFKSLVRSKSEDPAEIVNKDGKIGKLALNQLSPEIRTVVEKADIGSSTDPISLADGYAIFRVDARKDSETRPYEDNEVKNAVFQRLVMEKGQEQIDLYLKQLREDAFIEIDPKYQIPGLKTASAQIKVTPYSEESEKEKKKRLKREKKEKEQQEKAAAKAKETARK